MNRYAELFKEFFGPLSTAQRIMFAGLFLVIVGIIGGLFYWSQQEDQMLLFGSLDAEAAQEIVAELDNRGIKYKIEDGGRSIYVPSDRVHELRLDLAPMGGGISEIPGYELFDQNALGMTDFMQEVNKQRALEGEIARSINSLEQVEYSRIHIVMPERSPFDETAVQASASVILNLKPNRTLKPEQIEGITALIAGSIQDLEPQNITILDQAGNRLTDEIDYANEFGAGGTTQMQLRQKTEAYLTERGQSMLDRVLGAGNSILRVSVEHNFDRITRESDLIDPDSRTVYHILFYFHQGVKLLQYYIHHLRTDVFHSGDLQSNPLNLFFIKRFHHLGSRFCSHTHDENGGLLHSGKIYRWGFCCCLFFWHGDACLNR